MANTHLIRIAAVAALVAVSSNRALVQAPAQTPAVVPVVISGKVPQVLPITVQAKMHGFVVVRVTTDGDKVSSVEVVRPAPMFTEPVLEAVRTWQFAPHTPTTFETSVTYSFRNPEPICYNQDRNTHWSLALPLKIDVNPVGVVLCENFGFDAGAIGRLRGRLRCDCQGRPPVSGAPIEVLGYRDGGNLFKKTTTDKTGRFDMGVLPPGRYRVDIHAARFLATTFSIDVVPAAARRELDLSLKIDNLTVPPPPADVTASEAPMYPETARLAGVEGVVGLRVEADRTVTVLRGPAELAAAALANVKSWTFQEGPKEAFDIRFRYALMPGDCSGDQNPRVTMQLPLQVEVIAKRRIVCGNTAEHSVSRSGR